MSEVKKINKQTKQHTVVYSSRNTSPETFLLRFLPACLGGGVAARAQALSLSQLPKASFEEVTFHVGVNPITDFLRRKRQNQRGNETNEHDAEK